MVKSAKKIAVSALIITVFLLGSVVWYYQRQLAEYQSQMNHVKMTSLTWGIGLTGYVGTAAVTVTNEGINTLYNLTITVTIYFNDSGFQKKYHQNEASIKTIEPNETKTASVILTTREGSLEGRYEFWNITSRSDSFCQIVITTSDGSVLDQWEVYNFGNPLTIRTSKVTKR